MKISHSWSAKVGGSGVDQSHVIDPTSTGEYFLIAGEFPNSVDFDPGPGTAIENSFGLDDIYFAKYSEGPAGANDRPPHGFKVLVYPNPANEGLFIYFNGENATATLLELNGRTILTADLTSRQNRIDISQFANGIYFARVIVEGQVLITRFSVVR